MKTSILDCVPRGYILRDVQKSFLLWVEQNWDKDVLAGVIPVGGGKSLCLIAIAEWCKRNNLGNVAGIAPTIILQDQYQDKHPEIHMLKGMRHYKCLCREGKTCADTKVKLGRFCGKEEGVCCNYLNNKKISQASTFSLFNFHSMSYNEIFKEVLICDEGHNARNHVIDRFSLNIWKCEDSFPDFKVTGDFWGRGKIIDAQQLLDWLKKKHAELELILTSMRINETDQSILKRTEDKKTKYEDVIQAVNEDKESMLILLKKGNYNTSDIMYKDYDNTQQEYIYIKPKKIKRLAEKYLWPTGITKKIIFLSATFKEKDLQILGLDDRKFAIFEGDSPIPKEDREIRYWPIASMVMKDRQESIPKIALACIKLAEKHNNEKGIIHCTYEVAAEIRKIGFRSKESSRFMFHTKKDKTEVYNRFLESKKPSILIASGMNEGIDLAGDLARWQVITMLLRPNLADDLNWDILKNDPGFYDLLTARMTEQTAGRVSRFKGDRGYTYIICSDFWFFYKKTHFYAEKSLWSDGFVESLVLPKQK